jgi:hypothetical protein
LFKAAARFVSEFSHDPAHEHHIREAVDAVMGLYEVKTPVRYIDPPPDDMHARYQDRQWALFLRAESAQAELEKLAALWPTAHVEPPLASAGLPVVSPAVTPPAPPAEMEPLTPEQRTKVWKDLKPCERKAYLSWRYAEGEVERGLEDRAAYDFLKENGIEPNGTDLGELTNYELPPFDTWCSYVIKARGRLHENKNKSRGRPRKTRSIV